MTMDTNSVETINVRWLVCEVNVTVTALAGSSVGNGNIELGLAGGDGNGAVDTIVINETNGNDVISVANNNGLVTVSGLAATLTIANFFFFFQAEDGIRDLYVTGVQTCALPI